jgi:hypothetical protein
MDKKGRLLRRMPAQPIREVKTAEEEASKETADECEWEWGKESERRTCQFGRVRNSYSVRFRPYIEHSEQAEYQRGERVARELSNSNPSSVRYFID